jgi:ornithine cyclodeaminase/alanine dehydrogenase
MQTLLLSGDDVRALLTPEAAVAAVEHAFAAHGRGETIMPPKVYLSLPKYDGDFRGMPAYLEGFAGLKWVNSHPKNPTKHKLPAVMAVYILSDPSNAAPLAIMDGTALTAMRTGAGAAVATKTLARKNARVLGVVGCGAQARTLVACHRRVMTIAELRLYDRETAAAQRFAGEIKDIPARVCTLDEAAAADVLCTTTPSRAPVVPSSVVGAGLHINAIGADAPGKQELDPDILKRARVFVDDREQGFESGEVNVPLHSGLLQEHDIAGTLGEVVAGLLPGRTSDSDVTVFDSTGLAVQDLAVARVIYDGARKSGRGVDFELIRS